jgi:DNA modification methylase
MTSYKPTFHANSDVFWRIQRCFPNWRRYCSGDLDFHQRSSTYATHNIHAFPAKFPPQLPRKFIRVLTDENDVVFDPMSGSGTTLLECYLANRAVIALDIDPLALLLGRVKVSNYDLQLLSQSASDVIQHARDYLQSSLLTQYESRFDAKTRDFIDYWFTQQTRDELLALINAIEAVSPAPIQDFLKLMFSSVIITKSGGVSLARDLAHTRPHKVDDKQQRSTLVAFEKRVKRSLHSFSQMPLMDAPVHLGWGDAQMMPLANNTVDLIVTSPPYAANAIDYMRAHKFSLAWFGYPIQTLSKLRRDYIGGEALTGQQFEMMPPTTQQIIERIAKADEKKGRVLLRYYSEMTRTLSEILRVLKPGKAAVVVVGSSTIRGIDTQTHNCLVEIGETLGFEVPKVGVRHLDRDRRMMPTRRGNKQTQIEERMHEEYVIGYYKSEA